MREFRVKYWHENYDGREDYMEFDTMEEAQAFYDSLGGRAEIEKYNEERHYYETVVRPEFESREG